MSYRNRRSAALAAILTTTTAGFCGLMVAGPFGAEGATPPSASAARTISLNETGTLRLVSKHGFTLSEQGTATGTIRGAISVQLKIVSTSRVSAEVTISP